VSGASVQSSSRCLVERGASSAGRHKHSQNSVLHKDIVKPTSQCGRVGFRRNKKEGSRAGSWCQGCRRICSCRLPSTLCLVHPGRSSSRPTLFLVWQPSSGVGWGYIQGFDVCRVRLWPLRWCRGVNGLKRQNSLCRGLATCSFVRRTTLSSAVPLLPFAPFIAT